MYRHPNLRIGFFSQYQVDALDMTATALESMRRRFAGLNELDARKALGRFGLKGSLALQRMSTLSGGQRSRVLLAELAFSNPHMLLLDEVTNHLDMESIEALIKALNEFEGGVVFVSHDQHFISSVASSLYLVDHGKVEPFQGSIKDFVDNSM